MRVTDPDGVEWIVSRQWLRDRRFRWDRPRGLPGGWTREDLIVESLLTAVLLIFFAAVVTGAPVQLELALFAIGLGGSVWRFVFHYPWVVEARSERGELAWRLRGLFASRRAIHDVAAALTRGDRSFMPAGAVRLLPDSPLRQCSR